LFNVRRSNRDSEAALEMLVEHRPRFSAMLTHEVPIEDISRAFEILDGYHDGVGKALIRL
jgi:threonine dehydrogenase-like Zn-dependent dehydrogenase